MKSTPQTYNTKKGKLAKNKQDKKKVVEESSDDDSSVVYETVSESESENDDNEDTDSTCSIDDDEEEDEEDDEEEDDEEEDEEEDDEDDEEDDEYASDTDESNKKRKRRSSTRRRAREEEPSDEDVKNSFIKLIKRTAIEIAEKEEKKLNKKARKTEKTDKKDKTEKKANTKSKKEDKKKTNKSKAKKNSRRSSSSEEDEYEDDDEDEDDEDYEEEDDDEEPMVFLSIDGFGAINNDETDFKQMMKEDKNETVNSDDEETFMKEAYKPMKKDKSSPKKNHNHKKKDKKASKDKESEEESDKGPSVEDQYAEFVRVRQDLLEQLEKTPKNKVLQKAVKQCRKSITELVKKERIKNTQAYYKLVHEDPKDKKNTNEMAFFKKKLSHKEQMRVMKDLKEINAFTNTDKPYRLALLETDIPAKFKAIALQKLNILKSMNPSDSEYYKMKNWVDGFMRVPFGLYKNLSVTLDDGKDKCSDYLKSAKETLDACTYGLNDAKLQILQMVGQWISNPSAMGTAIAIKGPPGTGKTTLVKDGISKILGREFAFIALGGTSDASFLEGHSYTYEGSTWGKIVSILMECKCMNPVIYFDELDKISDTPKGEEIASILTHLTDTSQNSQYHDKYFSEVSFDVSKCLFIFSYNDESKVNPILKDRMYRIQTKGYEAKEKIIIARKHLLPKIREQINFLEEDVIIPDPTLEHIINHPSFCKGEQGVRNLKRCLEIIYTKLNLFRLVNTNEKLFAKDIELEVSFPFTVEKKHVDVLIKSDDPLNQSMLAMYV
jgi:ATP-dependent Lon protease